MSGVTPAFPQVEQRPRSFTLTGAGLGAAVSFAVAVIYQLIRIGLHLAATHTSAAPPDSADRIFGIYVVGGLLSLLPSAAAGAVTGALVAEALGRTWKWQGPIRAWLTGSLVAYAVAFVISAVILSRNRPVPLDHTTWAHTVGYPSILLVVVFGIVGLWLYLSRTWTIKD